MLLHMSLWGAALILAAALLRLFALNRVPKTAFLALWALALFRLLVPLRLDVTLPAALLDIPAAGQLLSLGEGLLTHPEEAAPLAQADAGTSAAPRTLLLLVWGAVAAGLFLYFLIRHLHCVRRYRLAVPAENAYIQAWQRRHSLRWRTLKVKVSPDISASLTYGLFRPVILLPKATDWTNEARLTYILLHELTHIRRLDILWKWLLTVAVCIYWFNPCVWLLHSLANRDLELSCDARVLQILGDDSRTPYAQALIGLAEVQAGLMALSNGFSQNAVKERVIAIMKFQKTTRFSICIAAAAVLCALAILGMSTVSHGGEAAPQVTGPAGDYELLDAEGNLLYYHTTDEAGNDLYLDTVPEREQGDILFDGTYVFGSEISCTDGAAGTHTLENGHMAIYTNQGGTWTLATGQEVLVTLDVASVDSKGWYILFGYEKDGAYTEYATGWVNAGEASFSFAAPADGAYRFFVLNASASPVTCNSCAITAG